MILKFEEEVHNVMDPRVKMFDFKIILILCSVVFFFNCATCKVISNKENVFNGVNVESKNKDQSITRDCQLSPDLIEEIQGYQPIVDSIIDFVMGEFKGKTYQTMATMVDNFGPRMTGSGVLEAAINYMIEESRREGLENVVTEDVEVPHWVRGEESAYLTFPRRQQLSLLGLGPSIETPEGGIKAEVLVVRSFEELTNRSSEAQGKIVVFNPPYISYGDSAPYRIFGAVEAAKVGAVATLIRTVASFSLNSPHTGWELVDESVPMIPAACIAVEDAELLDRMQSRGDILEVHLTMGAITYSNAISRNTFAEVEGSSLPKEKVVVSGHLDSWDVGQGAMDDAGGVFVSWNAAVILKRLNLRPKRTVQVILWTAEEQAVVGGTAFFEAHKEEKDLYQLMMESDSGTFSPFGLSFSGNDQAVCIMQEILNLLHGLNTTQLTTPVDGTPDLDQWAAAGVPTAGLLNENDKYFWYHHSGADTVGVEDPDVLDRIVALWTSVAYVAADLSIQIPR